jgi:hypothetical protein
MAMLDRVPYVQWKLGKHTQMDIFGSLLALPKVHNKISAVFGPRPDQQVDNGIRSKDEFPKRWVQN